MLNKLQERLMRRFSQLLLTFTYVFGTIVGHCFYVLSGSRARYGQINLRLCFPNLSTPQRNQLLKRNFRETGKLFCEMLVCWFTPQGFCNRSIRKVHGEHLIHAAREAGKGVILICPHLGNWEIFNLYAGRHQATVLYKPLKPAWLDKRVQYCRQRYGSKLVPTSSQGVKSLCSELSQGGVVTLFPDQVPKCKGRLMVPFFDTPAWTGTLVSKLSQKPDVVVIFGFASRMQGNNGFEVYLNAAPAEIYSSDLEQSVQALNVGIEHCIRQCPQQYTWQYKRFKDSIYPNLYESTNP